MTNRVLKSQRLGKFCRRARDTKVFILWDELNREVESALSAKTISRLVHNPGLTQDFTIPQVWALVKEEAENSLGYCFRIDLDHSRVISINGKSPPEIYLLYRWVRSQREPRRFPGLDFKRGLSSVRAGLQSPPLGPANSKQVPQQDPTS